MAVAFQPLARASHVACGVNSEIKKRVSQYELTMVKYPIFPTRLGLRCVLALFLSLSLSSFLSVLASPDTTWSPAPPPTHAASVHTTQVRCPRRSGMGSCSCKEGKASCFLRIPYFARFTHSDSHAVNSRDGLELCGWLRGVRLPGQGRPAQARQGGRCQGQPCPEGPG